MDILKICVKLSLKEQNALGFYLRYYKIKTSKNDFHFITIGQRFLKSPTPSLCDAKIPSKKKKLHALGTQRKTRQNRFYPILVPAQKKLSYHYDSAKLLITAL